MTVEELREEFEFLEDWEERFRYIVELGRELEPMDEADKTEDHRVLGCQSRVWIKSELRTSAEPTLHFVGDSDAQLVRGLMAIVLDVYNDQSPQFILDYDVRELFRELNLAKHLTPSRANGLNSMVDYIR
ncbi:MAG: SufE family protein, partial [Caldilineaceae bacterium]|nr:SufE family protein [Caldilineaceae bacterium]